MIRIVSMAAAFAAFVVTSAAAAPLEAYGKLPTIEDIEISPSGHAIAAVVSDGKNRVVSVQDLASGKILMKVGAGDVKVRGVEWAGDKHILVVATATAAPLGIAGGRREWMVAYSYDLTSQKPQRVLRGVEQTLDTLFDAPVVRTFRGEPTVFVQGVRFFSGQSRLTLFRYDLDTGKSVLVDEVGEDVRDWVVGPDGKAVAHEVYDSRSGRWALKIRNGGGWREVRTAVAPLERPYLSGLGRTPQTVLFAEYDDDGRSVWREVDLATGAIGEPIPRIDSQGSVRDPVDGRLIGRAALVGDKLVYDFFDEADARAWRSVQAAFPDSLVSLASWSADRKKIVVIADSPRRGPGLCARGHRHQEGHLAGRGLQRPQPRGHRAEEADPLQGGRRPGTHRLPDHAGRPRGEGAPARRDAARRPGEP
ncbi:hypothetical protein [Phenylobacterium sp. J367]|uniref:hypothetical protein n=1 Tax=Phenylobacterium sp. J367 TaxID=2898435 RepID=UPI002150DDC2|nr:hypothetical protein [Phenylobacterium sp. J367]MCR5877109.1 hypothetical protein [Phenylobacterium sp. J367]